jgi:hypothetical protein
MTLNDERLSTTERAALLALLGACCDVHGRMADGVPVSGEVRGTFNQRNYSQDSLGPVANGSATDLLKETIGGASFQAGTPCSGLATGYLSSLTSAQCEWFI